MAFKGGVVLGTVSFNATGSGTTAIGATSNSGTIAIGNTSSGAVSIDCGTAGITVGTTANAHATTVGSTNSTSATTVQSGSGALNVTATNGALTINSGTGNLSISTDASATTVAIATGGAVKGVTLGSTNSTSATTVQSGSGALNVTSTNGALTINSGTGALGISTDASATTVSIATGGAVKGVTLGSTNTTSSTAIKSGSGNIAFNSGLTIDSSGRYTTTVQPLFLAYKSSSSTNVTGDNTVYTIIFNTAIKNQGSSYNTGTGTFTAPVTGTYFLCAAANLSGVSASYNQVFIIFNATSRAVQGTDQNGGTATVANALQMMVHTYLDMTAGDTCIVQVQAGNSTKTVGVVGSANLVTFFGGMQVA